MADERVRSAEREAAWQASRGCPFCGGEGTTQAFHREYRGRKVIDYVNHDGIQMRIPGIIAVHCSCAMGTWTRSKVDPETRRRIPPISQIASGRTSYTLDDPTEPEIRNELEGMKPTQMLAWLQRAKERSTKRATSSDIPAHEKSAPDSRDVSDVPF